MAYGSSTEGGYGIGASVFHFDASHPDRIDIPDAELLFRGHFGRSGPDLLLTGQDGHRHIVPDYFASEKHPSLYAPNGAHLSGDLVDLLTGPQAPRQYAQATTTPPADAIGKIEKVVGVVNVVRNGVAVVLHVGDAVYKSDVIQTGSSSSCGISFPDGTALNLIANTRMALNDYSFDPNGTSNSALFSLVEGTFAFVAGKVAHTGDMQIATPVATMGIRGTAGWAGHQLPAISSILGDVYGFALAHDPGVNTSGRYMLLKHDLDGNPVLDASGNPVILDSVGSLDVLALCSVDSCTHLPMTSGLSAFGQGIMQGAYDASNATNPGANPGGHGSGDQPFAPQFQENGTQEQIQFINFTVTAGSSSLPPTFVVTTPPPIATQATQATIEIGTIETNNTFIQTNDIINQADAAAGVVISGTASGSNIVGRPVTVEILNAADAIVETYTTTVRSNDTWSVNVTQAQAQALADGHYTVSASISTTAGTSATASHTVIVDETPATIAIGTVETSNVVNKAEAAAGITIGGTVSDPLIDGSSDIVGQTVFLTLNGKTYTGAVQPNNTWSVSIGPSGLALTDGVYKVTADVTDKAGNVSPEASQLVTVDTVTPTVSVTTDSADVNLAHNTATIGFTFSEAPGSSFTLADTSFSGGVLSNLLKVDSTHYTATFTANPNTYTDDAVVSVVAGSWSENNGNPGSGGSTAPFVVDTVAPTVSVTTDSADVNLAHNTATIGFTFSEAPGSSFTLADTTFSGGVLSNLLKVDSTHYTATFTANPNTYTDDAVVSVVAGSWSENNGNPGSGGSTAPFVVDTVAPTVSVTTDSADVNLAHNTATIGFTFSEAPGSSFTLADTSFSGGVLSNLLKVDSTHYTATFTANPNTYTDDAVVSVVAGSWSENNGNPGSGGSTAPFVVDTVAPTVTFASEHEDGETWTLTGTDSDYGGPGVKSVQIFEGSANGVFLGTAQLTENGTWSFTRGPLSDGWLTFVAEVTDQAGNTATASVMVDDRIPAGVAGSPIDLALTDPSAAQATGPITVTVAGLPPDWSLNNGSDLGNGTWTVRASDLSALTVTTAATYAGAMVLNITENWPAADGSTAMATVADNVEAYAPGAPIFALPGNDTLTGGGDSNEFVFAQPIGNDTIYNFHVATDKIDLIGFANIVGFGDIQPTLTSDGNHNAIITLGAGETITLKGVDAASLTANDFLFNQDAGNK